MARQVYDRRYFRGALRAKTPFSQRNRLWLSFIRRFVPKGRLLEVGFGQGGLLRLATQYYDVRGIDISPYAVNVARQYLGDRVRCADISEERLPSEAFDVVAAFGVLEHLAQPAPAIADLHGALAQGGVLIGGVPHNNGLVGRINTTIANTVDRTHCSTYERERWRRLFGEAGFRDIRFCGEITVTRNLAFFVERPVWRHISFNLIFACTK